MAPTTALAPSTISEDEITAALRQAGFIEPESASSFSRITMNGFMFTLDDGTVFTSNPKTGTPAFRARILGPAIEYQAAWIDDSKGLATAIGRQGFKGFCKSYFADPSQGRKRSESGHDCTTCPIGPFVKKEDLPLEADGKRCSWKGDIQMQILDADGETISDPKVHTLSMAVTGVIEFKGTGREAQKGSVSDLNFVQKLARFGLASDPENPQRGMFEALTALGEGRVIADVAALPMQNQDKSRSWTVPSFTPVFIVPADDAAPALSEGTTPGTAGLPDDDLPF